MAPSTPNRSSICCFLALVVSATTAHRILINSVFLDSIGNPVNFTNRQNATDAPGWLELEYHVNQRPKYKEKGKWKSTWACWLLSVVEGLHVQKVTEKFFTSGLIQAEEPNEDFEISWATRGGGGRTKSGIFEIYDDTYRGSWQQIIETIFGQVFRVSGLNFQKRIGDAPKGGGSGRAAVIEKYFQLIDSRIHVEGEMQGIHGSTTIQQLNKIFTRSRMGPGTATVWTIDKNSKHAIAVHDVISKDGWYELETFNQAIDEDEGYPRDAYAIEPRRRDGCYSMNNHENTCKEVFKFTFTGLPP